MGTLKVQGFDELDAAFRRIADIPDEVKSDALVSMAQVAAEKIKASGEAMGVRDPESEMHILDKITLTKPKLSETGGSIDITFSGSRTRGKTRTRNAEIAFINEYGKRNQPARPFIGTAMTKNEEAIAGPGADVLWDWVEKDFLK